MTRFAILAHGTRGDVDPFLGLARVLHGRGHDVTVHTHAAYAGAARRGGPAFRAVDRVDAYERHLRRTRELIRARDPRHIDEYYRDADLFLDRISIAGGYDQIRRETRMLAGNDERTVFVCRSHSSISALIAAELTGSPICQISLSPFQLMTASVTALHLARSAGDRVNELRAGFGLPPVERWARWLTRADLTAGLWPHRFDEAGLPSGADVFLPGFPLADQESRGASGSAAVAARREDVILISGGTGRMLHEGFYAAAIAGLTWAGRRGIVVTRHPDLLPRPLPSGVEHRMSLPFDVVMPSVAGVVHHGGIGTVARALASGTPQLLLADGADRPDNGNRLKRLGWARSLGPGRWDPVTVGAEIARLRSPAPVGPALPADTLESLADRVTALEAGPAGRQDVTP